MDDFDGDAGDFGICTLMMCFYPWKSHAMSHVIIACAAVDNFAEKCCCSRHVDDIVHMFIDCDGINNVVDAFGDCIFPFKFPRAP